MKQFIPNWFKDNFRIKVGLLCLAILLWFLVVTEKSYDYVSEVPLIPTHVRAGKMITNNIPEVALVKFRASGKELLKLIFYSKPNLRINLSTIMNQYKFDIRPDMVEISGGLIANVLEVLYPDSLEFILDDILEKEVLVNSNILVKTAPGYTMVGDITLNPSKIIIIGPKGKLVSVKSIGSDSTSLMDASRNTVITLKLKEPDVLGCRLMPDHVEAVIKIEKIGERKITGIPVMVKNQPHNLDAALEPGTVDVVVSGAISAISALTIVDIRATTDYRFYNPRRSNRVPVKLEVNSTVDIVEILPKDVRMIVRRK